MEKSKLKTIAIIGLVVLNLTTLGFIFFNAPKRGLHPPMDRMRPKDMIVRKLHFDENQKKEFEKLIEWHQAEIQKHDDKIRNAKIELYSLLVEKSIDTNKKEILIDVISQHQKEIEEAHFKHFEDIKKICTQNQIEEFNNLSKELPRVFGPNKGEYQPRNVREPRDPRENTDHRPPGERHPND